MPDPFPFLSTTVLARAAVLCGLSAFFAVPLHAQLRPQTGVQPGTAEDAPDAPSVVMAALDDQAEAAAPRQNAVPTQNAARDSAAGNPKQTKRILGIVPNFRAVSADTKLPPQTVAQKFKGTSQDSFDYSSVVFSAILAGVAQIESSEPRFGTGISGYGQYLYHTYADQTDENFWVQFILPSVLHQDSRYYTLGRGSIAHRAVYAFDRTLITRKDSGGNTFNYSEIVGAGAASGISTWYYPQNEQTWTKTGQRWLQNVVIDGGTYVFQEFWPNINQHLFHTQ